MAMNTWAKIGIVTVVLGGGVVVYLSVQPTPGEAGRDEPLNPTTRLVDTAPALSGVGVGVGSGERPWANQYDDRGELAYQFRATSYEPRDGGTVLVAEPVVKFFLTGGQVVQLEGRVGTVYLPSGGDGGGSRRAEGGAGFRGGSAGVPSRGVMKDVRIRVYETAEQAKAGVRPFVTAQMDNVAFDNDTLRIATESFVDAAGREVPADKVPVIVRGDDYDFDGEGLTIRINQRDRSIQTLEVARGTRLVVKNPELMQAFEGTGAVGMIEEGRGGPVGEALAAQDRAAVAQAMPAREATAVYRTTLRNSVKIVQGDGTTATGDVLQVDYGMSRERRSGESAKPAGNAAAPATPAPATSAAAKPAPVSAPATARKPEAEAVVVTWDGPLRVVANAGDPAVPARQSVTTLSGSAERPAEVRQKGSVARAAAAIYESQTRTASLQGTDTRPVILEDDRGSVVTTPLLKYDTKTRLARMFGATVVRANVDTDEAGKPRTMLATWSKQGSFQFVRPERGAGGGQRIGNAVIEGDVSVEHPQMSLRSGTLALDFDPAAKRERRRQGENAGGQKPADADLAGGAELKRVFATGNVRATIIDDRAPQTAAAGPGIRGDELLLTLARDPQGGRSYPDRIESRGNVQATDGKQLLTSQQLVLELEPERKKGTAGMGASKVRTVVATGDVAATGEDGSVARAGKLTVRDASGKPDITLEAGGGREASVQGPDATLTAGLVHYTTADGKARVPGPGKLAGVRRSEPAGETGTPFAVTWAGSALFDPSADRADVEGDVRFETTDREGAVSVATGKTLTLSLADAPKAAPGSPARRETPGLATGGVMTRKELRGIELAGGVKLESVLGDAKGALARQFTLFSERVKYDAPGAGGIGGGFVAPGPGRLLMVDRRAEPTAGDEAERGMPNGRGTTAMRWRDGLTYSPATRELDFVGNVMFVHQPLQPGVTPEGKPEDAYRLEADRVKALLSAPPEKRGGAAAAGGAGAAGLEAGQLENVSAAGAVVFSGRGVTVRAVQMDFAPESQVVTAAGRDRVPVFVDDSRGTGTGSFDSVKYNLKTGQIDDLRNPTGNVSGGAVKLPGQQPKVPPATQGK